MCPSLKDLLQYGFDVPYSTLKNYYSEQSLLPKSFFEDLCYVAKINSSDLNIKYLSGNWGYVKGGKKGIVSMMKKYKKQLPKWRLKGSAAIAGFNLKKIRYPQLDEKLAEFIGIYLGDGTITKYFIKISGDNRYDKPYFNYIADLVYELFGLKSKIVKDRREGINTVYLIISSKSLCEFLRDNYWIKYGHKIKNKTCVPSEILKDDKLSVACLRGLIDTDGSVSRRGKNGCQFCLNFTAHNPLLFEQANKIGKKLGIFTYSTGNHVGTNKWENILKYFKIVGSSNLRHIVRFCVRHETGEAIYQREVLDHYKKPFYKDIVLPFKMDL